MIDLYFLVVPFFGVLSAASVYILKEALSEPKIADLNNYQKKIDFNQHINTNQIMPVTKRESTQNGEKPDKNAKNPENAKSVSSQQVLSTFATTYKYLLKNFTLAQLCMVRRGRNKVPLLLSISLIGLFVLLVAIMPIIFCSLGVLVVIVYASGKILSEGKQSDEPSVQNVWQVKPEKIQQKSNRLEVIMMGLALFTNVACMYLTYKNYNNEFLATAALNFAVAVALDNFIVRPLAFAVFAFFINNLQVVNNFIKNDQQTVQILHGIRVRKGKQRIEADDIAAISPKKKRNSPTKVPKAEQDDDKQNRYKSSLDLTRNILKSSLGGKPRLSPINQKRRTTSIDQRGDCSLLSILNSNDKKRNPHRKNESISFDFDKQLFEDSKRKNKQYTQKVRINPDGSIIDNINMENQQDQYENYKGERSPKNADYSRSCKGFDPLIVQQKDYNNEFNENQDNYYQNRTENTNDGQWVEDAKSCNRKNSLLNIRENRKAEEIEQIDLNSPDRRRRKFQVQQEGKTTERSVIKKKKSHKKHSFDPNRHVIKHHTGQPYLEYLPRLLSKQREEKIRKTSQHSQQNISRKFDLMLECGSSKYVSSVRKGKKSHNPIVRGNDENQIPEFIVEDFQ